MADTVTPNYNFVQPEVGASNDTWGNKMNANMASIDTILKALSDTFAGYYTKAQIDAALANYYTKTQIDAALEDYWAFQAIGAPIPANMGIAGFAAPPRNKGYRYIVLTAGQTGAGLYNEGVLVSESVSGSNPNINATAVISLAGSPLNGGTVALINTSREFLRPSNSVGAQENSQNLSHAHGVVDAGHGHGLNITIGSSGTGAAFNQAAAAANETPTTRGNAAIAGTGISIAASGGDESRPRNRGVQHYMRIK